MKTRSVSIVSAIAIFLILCSSLSAQKPFAVEDHWKVGGQGGWDYLLDDSPAQRLYVTHGTRVEVVDTTSGRVTGTIDGLNGSHGITLDTNGRTGYISDGGSNEVIVFDRATLAKLGSVATGTNPDGIIFEPKTNSVLTLNGGSNDATLIDAATRKVVATLSLPGKPEFPTVDGSGSVFVNIEDKNEIVRLDLRTRTITATWPLSGCESPTGMAIDVAGHRLFSVCDRRMSIIDFRTGRSLATPAIGAGADAAIYDPKQHIAFSSNGQSGTLTVVDAGKPGYAILQTLKTQISGRTMAFDSERNKLYVVVAELGSRPAATPANPHPRPAIVPGTFTILVIGCK